MKIIVEQADITETEVILRCADPTDAEIYKIKAALADMNKQIPVQQTDRLLLLKPQDILYCEYVDRHVFLYTAQDMFPSGLSLSQLELEYPDFFRCSKNTIVNIKQLTHLKSEIHGRILASLSNGEQILISRHYASTLRNRLKQK